MINRTEAAANTTRSAFDLDLFIISLKGEFDIAERARLLDAFAVSTSAPLVVINFEKTRYVDSSVLECIVALERATAKRDANLILIGLRPEVRRVFEVCGLEKILDIRTELSDATRGSEINPSRVRRLALISEPATEPEVAHVGEV